MISASCSSGSPPTHTYTYVVSLGTLSIRCQVGIRCIRDLLVDIPVKSKGEKREVEESFQTRGQIKELLVTGRLGRKSFRL